MQQRKDYFTSKSSLTGLAIILLLMLCAAYSNHFGNGFEYDDSNSIVDNTYIRNIKNLPLFFTDVKYFGTNGNNQGYRPVVVSLNAIDYWLAGGLNPAYFHADIFLSYIALLVLLFFLFKSIFNTGSEMSWRGTKPSRPNNEGLLHSVRNDSPLIALLAVGFYGLHTANAETINYIIQRGDSFSTLLIVASLLLYIHPKSRKYYLYIPVIVLAIMTKEVGIITCGLIFFYVLLFEENTSLIDLITFRRFKNILNAFRKSLPALVCCYIVFYLIQKYFFWSHPATSASEGLPPILNYYATEALVFAHYLGNFFLPVNLSIGTGFIILTSVINLNVIFSFVLIIALVFVAFITSRKKENRPIAFGIIWFFVTLVPSSLMPKYGELSNDHRTFLPYIGLVMSLAWWLRLIYLRYVKRVEVGNKSKSNSKGTSATAPATTNFSLTYFLLACYFIIISLHAYGTYQRNIVWHSAESLWKDALSKNPDEAIALMNYGLVLMNKGEYNESFSCFERVLKLYPAERANVSVYMGVLKDFLGKPIEADSIFRNAIQLQPNLPYGYYQYARFLLRYGARQEALTQVQAGLKVSPGDAQLNELLNIAKAQTPESKLAEINKMAAFAAQNPTTANYLDLSVSYYKNEMYQDCIDACEKALKLDPANAMAYNNICSCYNALGQWAKAAEACNKSLRIDSTLQLAKNNLIKAQSMLK